MATANAKADYTPVKIKERKHKSALKRQLQTRKYFEGCLCEPPALFRRVARIDNCRFVGCGLVDANLMKLKPGTLVVVAAAVNERALFHVGELRNARPQPLSTGLTRKHHAIKNDGLLSAAAADAPCKLRKRRRRRRRFVFLKFFMLKCCECIWIHS